MNEIITGFMALLLLCAAIGTYFLPFLVATVRDRQVVSVFLLNLFLGWTFLGWLIALIWAFSDRK